MIAIALTIVLATWAGAGAERRWPERTVRGTRTALTIVLYAVVPLVVFFNLAGTEVDADHGVGIVLGWVAVAICAGIAYLVADRVLRLSRPEVGAVLCCVLVANTGMLGLPLVAAVLGFDRVGEAVLFDVGVTGIALLLGAFSVGAAFGTRAGEGAAARTRSFFARNVPLYAALLALLAPATLAPGWAVDGSRALIALLLPVGFFAVGAALAEGEERVSISLPPRLRGPVATAAIVKLLLFPALLVLLAAPLIELPGSFLLLAAMPSGLNTMVVGNAFGLDMKIIAGAVVWTTAIAVPVVLVATLL